jgi:hypothetical protein
MGKWYLFWILTVQHHDGITNDLPRMEIRVDSQSECMLEATAKREELELMIGGEWYSTHYYGGRVRLSGKLLGIAVGCDNG